MQNKGAIRLFAILIGLICVYQLSFTYFAGKVEKDAKVYAKGEKQKELAYLDSMSSEVVYNLLGLRKYTFKEVKELQLGLGLDLQGGMNVTLEVSVVDLVKSLSNYSKDSTFSAALKLAVEKQKKGQDDFVTSFGKAFEEISPSGKLASIFNTLELKDQIKYNSTNNEVLDVLHKETKIAIDNSFNIIRTRIDRFGVAQPNIQPLQTAGRILVELPGVDDPKRVRKLLQGTANLEFWETYDNSEVYQYLAQANQKLVEIQAIKTQASIAPADTTAKAAKKEDSNSLLSELDKTAKTDSASLDKNADINKQFPLFSVLSPSATADGQLYPGAAVGTSHFKDTATVNNYLKMDQVKALLPRNLIFKWTAKAIDKEEKFYRLIAIKVSSRDGKAPLEGDVITDARQDYADMGSQPEVTMNMNSEGAKTWARLTKENVGKSIAIVLDGYVRSYPNVIQEITGGRSSITGLESIEEAKDLANILKSGKMPAPAIIIAEDVVGPSLGREAINSGMWSFLIAFLLTLGYMLFFYSKRAGMTSNIALIVNVFFLIGILASVGAVLTLPGIAGIVLTMGMAVDANVLIYERVEEEMLAGKSLKLAVHDGFNAAYSAIIDGQVTTLLTGIVLFFFGSGPIKGFATTLIIGIITSLFTSIFITRLIFERQLKQNKPITFTSKFTKNWLRKTSVPFLAKRKIAYWVSGSLIVISFLSFAVRGFQAGIDFKGGRTYIVSFDKDVKVADVQSALAVVFSHTPEVKTYGNANTVRITTTYKIDDLSADADNQVEEEMYEGLKKSGFIGDISSDTFSKLNLKSSQKVGPTISDDLKKDAVIAVLLSLLMIFIYVAIRFKNWQYGMGGLLSLAHDAILTLGIFSIFYSISPFSMEVDQGFIAAILTVIGYSINDTVVVYDRIREYIHLYPKRTLADNMDHAMNTTLRRTFSTSLTVFIVLLAIFIFGGTSMQGFTFALLIGVFVGSYSTVFIAAPIVYDTILKVKKVSKI
ncbi:MAG: protein translocase subunit SecDF [Bacteroidota bacterium]|nr:protein translocase subunit SecDF [Odoribacter sp.]MDP3643010.1 protein translocase subunit SecDF [Bacteroidota bacterium]